MAGLLGKSAARHAVKFRFGDFFDASKLPKPPAGPFGHYQAVDDFHMLGNDKAGCCVLSGASHEEMIWTAMWGRKRSRFTVKDVYSDYTAITGFNPAKPETDQGTDMQVAADYRRKTGIIDAEGKRHKIDAYVSLAVGNVEQLVLAMWLFGAAGIGVQLPSTAEDQFDNCQPWSVPPTIRTIGGHYIVGAGRNAAGNLITVTWGKTQEMTPGFYQQFNDESVAYLSLEMLGEKQLSPEGFDEAGLRAALAKLGS